MTSARIASSIRTVAPIVETLAMAASFAVVMPNVLLAAINLYARANKDSLVTHKLVAVASNAKQTKIVPPINCARITFAKSPVSLANHAVKTPSALRKITNKYAIASPVSAVILSCVARPSTSVEMPHADQEPIVKTTKEHSIVPAEMVSSVIPTMKAVVLLSNAKQIAIVPFRPNVLRVEPVPSVATFAKKWSAALIPIVNRLITSLIAIVDPDMGVMPLIPTLDVVHCLHHAHCHRNVLPTRIATADIANHRVPPLTNVLWMRSARTANALIHARNQSHAE